MNQRVDESAAGFGDMHPGNRKEQCFTRERCHLGEGRSGPSRFRSCKAVHARPFAVVLAARGHGVTAARENGAHAPVGTSWLIIHVELKVSAPFECGALHRASSLVHREVVHTLGSDTVASAVDGSSQALKPPPMVRQQPGPTSRPRENCAASKAIIRTRIVRIDACSDDHAHVVTTVTAVVVYLALRRCAAGLHHENIELT